MNAAVNASPAYIANEAHLRQYLQEELGFNLDEVDLSWRFQQLAPREQTFDNFEDYASAIASLIAVHETHFLRHPDQFTWLQQYWLPHWLAKHQHTPHVLRVLSAGCATGEEPYSLAALLLPLLRETPHQLVVEGIDISKHALATAERGHYGLWSLRGIDVKHEQAWLHAGVRTVEVMPWVRNAVTFRQHNLTNPLNASKNYDLILCRNVLIYMSETAIAQIFTHLAHSLTHDGVLLLGPSDPSPPKNIGLHTYWHHDIRFVQHTHAEAIIRTAAHSTPHKSTEKTTPLKHKLHLSKKEKISRSATVLQDHAAIEALIHTGYYQQARELLETRLTTHPFEVRSHVMLALLLLDLNEHNAALSAARNASFLEPEAVFPMYLLANIRARIGDTDGARTQTRHIQNKLQQYTTDQSVPYCEEITVGQLMEVISAAL